MKMRCTTRLVFRGDVVNVGDILDITDEERKNDCRVDNDFVPLEDADAARRSASEPVVAGLTRAQAIAKLAKARVNVPDDATDEEIAKRFLEAFDAKKNHTVKG